MADSPHWTILDAVRTRLVAACPNVYLRKRAVVLQDDLLPAVVVSPGGGERVEFETFDQGVAYAYPVRVAYVARADGFAEPAFRAFVNGRAAVRDQLFQPALPGADTAFDARIDPAPAVEVPAGNSDGYDVAAFVLTVLSSEVRKS